MSAPPPRASTAGHTGKGTRHHSLCLNVAAASLSLSRAPALPGAHGKAQLSVCTDHTPSAGKDTCVRHQACGSQLAPPGWVTSGTNDQVTLFESCVPDYKIGNGYQVLKSHSLLRTATHVELHDSRTIMDIQCLLVWPSPGLRVRTVQGFDKLPRAHLTTMSFQQRRL